MDLSDITRLISTLRAQTARDSITPNGLGSILQRIVDAISSMSGIDVEDEAAILQRLSAAESNASTALQTAQNAQAGAAGNVIDSFTQSQDEDEVSLSIKQHGHSARQVVLPAASSTGAGIMTATDKSHLDTAYGKRVNLMSAPSSESVVTLTITFGDGTTKSVTFVGATAGTGGKAGLMTKEQADQLAALVAAGPAESVRDDAGYLKQQYAAPIILRNVTDTVFDDLAIGDVYYDTGHLFYHAEGASGDPDIGAPSRKVIYYCLADQTLYRWTGSRFVQAVSISSGDVTVPTKLSDLINDMGFLTAHQTLKTINGQTITGTGNITIDGAAELKDASNHIKQNSATPVVLRNVAETMLDDLNEGDVYFDSGHLFWHTESSSGDIDLGTPSKRLVYFCLGNSNFYRWGGSSFTKINMPAGADGTTPHIDATTGNWFIGTTDTGVHAQGPMGNTQLLNPSTFDPVTQIINNLTEGGEGDALSAEMGKKLNLRLSEVEDGKVDTEEDGFFVVDENGNIGMQYDEDGFDVALLSQHFIRLLNNAGIGSSYKSQCVVRFLPFLSAWNNDEKNSLCLCSTKQQLVDNKVPFYDGFLFHKLPTDDKSLWYGTTLDNAVQIGTMSVYPKNYQLAMSPKDGRVIAAIRGNGQQRADLHVWDGTTDTAVAAVSSDGNSRKPLGWLYNCGYDFIKNGNNEYMIFAEYNGDGTNKGGYYVWKGTYPYTSPNDWKTVFHRPYAGTTYGTIAYGTIAHFHMVRRDPWTNILYLAAGDYPTQLIWWYSTDYGETWTELTNNETNGWEQHVARACNMVFTKDYIYWANDHGVNHCLNRMARNAQTGIIDPSTREKLCDLRFGQACNSICYVESPHGLFMYERIDTGDEFSQQYGTPVKMYFWDIDKAKLYEVANVPLLSGQTWGGSRGKCYLNFTSGQQPRPAMGFSDDTRCIFDIAGSDGQNIGTIYYEL